MKRGVELEVGVAEQAHQVEGAGTHQRVLKVDKPEVLCLDHQVSALEVSMNQDPFGFGQLLGDGVEALLQDLGLSLRGLHTPCFEPPFDEMVELPSELWVVESLGECLTASVDFFPSALERDEQIDRSLVPDDPI